MRHFILNKHRNYSWGYAAWIVRAKALLVASIVTITASFFVGAVSVFITAQSASAYEGSDTNAAVVKGILDACSSARRQPFAASELSLAVRNIPAGTKLKDAGLKSSDKVFVWDGDLDTSIYEYYKDFLYRDMSSSYGETTFPLGQHDGGLSACDVATKIVAYGTSLYEKLDEDEKNDQAEDPGGNVDPIYSQCDIGEQSADGSCPAEDCTGTIGANGSCIVSTDDDDDGDRKSTCGIEGGLAWVLCPVIRTMASMTDSMFGFLADSFLSMPATIFNAETEEGKAMLSAWSRFRDLANVAFVVVFLVVIYSQITSIGLSNYGIKRMLPRLLIAALLVNVSFWLCAIAIDLSNIIGYGAKGFFDWISDTPQIQQSVQADSQGFGWSSVAMLVMAGTVIWLSLTSLIGFMGVALVTLVMIVVILLVRKALIILLIAVAPLAFVAYLLPNTKEWFDKWRKAFTALLMVFPIIGVVFGASSLASTIVQATSDSNLTKILGAAIAVIPLVVVPGLIKGSLSMLGTLGTKINGLGDKASGASAGWAKKKFDNTAIGRGRQLRKDAREMRRKEKFASAMTGKGWKGRGRRIVARGLSPRKYQRQYIDRKAYGDASAADAEEVKFGASQLGSQAQAESAKTGKSVEDILGEKYKEAIKKGDSKGARAAFDALGARGGGGLEVARKVMADHESDIDKDPSLKADLKRHVQAAGVKHKDARLTQWAEDKAGGLHVTRAENLKDEDIASQSEESLRSAIGAGSLDAKAAERILLNPELDKLVKNQRIRAVLDAHSKGLPIPPP